MKEEDFLPHIPGEMLGAAAQSSPEARTSEEHTLRVTVCLPDGQRAEVTFTRLRSRKGKGSHWFWFPSFAVLLDP
jgi:hypothetical protein